MSSRRSQRIRKKFAHFGKTASGGLSQLITIRAVMTTTTGKLWRGFNDRKRLGRKKRRKRRSGENNGKTIAERPSRRVFQRVFDRADTSITAR